MNKEELLKSLQPDREIIEQYMEQEIANVQDETLKNILTHALFNGGKRIRPLLTMLAGRLCAVAMTPEGVAEEGQLQPPENLYRLATVFELLHGASLLHDDVIDHADQRRGKPTANKIWGTSQVILAGDWLHATAMTMAGTLGGPEINTIIGSAVSAMIEAEFRQAETARTINLDEENYFAILRGKTSSLIAAACQTGASYVNENREYHLALRTFGDTMGLAFQVIDDLLDYQGDPEQTGKAVGNDLVEGKLTLPLLHAMENADKADHEQMIKLLKNEPELRKKHVEQVHDFIEANGGFAYAKEGAATLIEAGSEALELFPDCQAKTILLGLGQYVLYRQK